MDIPPQISSGSSGLADAGKLLPGNPQPAASTQLSVDVLKKLGLAVGQSFQVLVKEVANAGGMESATNPSMPTSLNDQQWNALLEIVATGTANIRNRNTSISPSISQPPLLQVASSKPLQVGQTILLVLDNMNRLQVIERSMKSTGTSPNILPANRQQLATLLYKTDGYKTTENTATLLQKLLGATIMRNANSVIRDNVYKILQTLPGNDQTKPAETFIKQWLSTQASLILRTANTNGSAMPARVAPTLSPEPGKQHPVFIETKIAEAPSVTDKTATRQAPDADIEKSIERIVKTLLETNPTEIVNGRQAEKMPINAAEILLILQKILTPKNESGTKISTNINENTAPKAKEEDVLDLVKNLLSRSAAVQDNHQLNQLHNGNSVSSLKCEIPVFHQQQINNAQLTIEKDKESASGKSLAINGIRWRIVLDFDLAELGLVQAEALIREQNVNIAVWAEKSGTQKLIVDRIDSFSEKLKAKGIPLESLHCRQEKSRQAKSNSLSSFIDLHG